jgi:hypothetical protein
VENEKEVYKTLDELLVAYVQCTNGFIDKLIQHSKFRSTEAQLNGFLETCLQNVPQYTSYGFCMDNDNPGGFICGYKSRPGTRMSKVVCISYVVGIFFFSFLFFFLFWIN